MTSKKISRLDSTVHSPVRLAILSILISVERADFNYLKKTTRTTDGNLSTHLSKLEEKGLIRMKKSFKRKKSLTTCSITEKGKKAFSDYLKALEEVIHFEKKD
jgi:DNA-binding MarR family transcriptional regulator